MSAVGKKMKPLDEEIKRVDGEIARLQGVRDGLIRAMALMSGDTEKTETIPVEARKRSANIKPLILDIMRSAGPTGATSNEVSALVKERVPTVAKYTVGSVLSRLKADKALAHDGERYYDARFAPKADQRPFEPKVAA